ncbi:MAG: hypothetical protein RIS85_2757 [Pseudomonadota bacterium]
MSRLSKTFAVMVLVLALAYYWLLVNAGPAGVPARKVDLAQLREAANQMPGEKPTALEYVPIAGRTIPGAALAAGTGLRQIHTATIAWHIKAPSGDIVIDSGMQAADAKAMDFNHYDPKARKLVDAWMDKAALILFTHEHIDHVGGFLDHPNFRAIAEKAVISPDLMRGMTGLWRDNARFLPAPRPLAQLQAVAPGVVLVQAPGHTPASQMIYVRLQNGREYLFPGDTASLAANFDLPTPRSRLVSEWMVEEDRPAVIGWLKGIKALKTRHPALVVIPSHDPDWLAARAPRDGFTRAGQ